MRVDFPSRVTIVLPALLREGLQQLQVEESASNAAVLIELLLAEGIKVRLARRVAERGVAPRSTEVKESVESKLPHEVTVSLDREQRHRLAKLLTSQDSGELSDLVNWMFDWGLDAYERRLSIEQPSNCEEEAPT